MTSPASHTERIPFSNLAVPPLSEVSTRKSGPTIEWLRRRTIVVYAVMCAVGLTPFLLSRLAGMDISPRLQAAALGLLFPGAGLIAVGTIWCTVLGVAFYAAYVKFGATIWGLPFALMLIAYLWLLSIAGGVLIVDVDPPIYSVILMVVLPAFTIVRKSAFANRKYRANLERRKQHEEYIDSEVARLEREAVDPQPKESRELSLDAVKATRFLYEMTLREPGDFRDFESVEQILSSAYRYSLDYLGYSLALLQYGYLRNFHGYLNAAQRYVIESFTFPEVCGYWKWEYLGNNFRWNPDPIRHLNVMFSGWSGLVITLYGANTGDLRYEEPGALKFRPFKNRSRTYDYSSKDVVESLVRNWTEYVSTLFPCEPHLTFPQCNTYAMDAVLAYDRHHGTSYLEEAFPRIDSRFREDFILPSGDLPFVHNTLMGLRSFEDHPSAIDGANAFVTSRILNAVYPGLARRTYLFALNDFVKFGGEEPEFALMSWADMVDGGNFKRGPAYDIGLIATSAAEFGDRRVVEQMLEVAAKYLERREDDSVFAYRNASVIGNALIASARYTQKDDFYNMIHAGPGPDSMRGPVLDECSYPEVLVARAMSDGSDLDLVLYNGASAGKQRIGMARMRPGGTYRVERSDLRFTADGSGRASVEVELNGRTPIHVVPE